MTEDQLEQEALGWLEEAGYTPQRSGYRPRRQPTRNAVAHPGHFATASARRHRPVESKYTAAAREDSLSNR